MYFYKAGSLRFLLIANRGIDIAFLQRIKRKTVQAGCFNKPVNKTPRNVYCYKCRPMILLSVNLVTYKWRLILNVSHQYSLVVFELSMEDNLSMYYGGVMFFLKKTCRRRRQKKNKKNLTPNKQTNKNLTRPQLPAPPPPGSQMMRP